eukprot:2791872-Alexandrium_andersonii.AAC.1
MYSRPLRSLRSSVKHSWMKRLRMPSLRKTPQSASSWPWKFGHVLKAVVSAALMPCRMCSKP